MNNCKILKYVIPLQMESNISLQIGSEILSIQEQYGEITVWMSVPVKAPVGKRLFHIRGTGDDSLCWMHSHLATIQLNGFVWHIFDGGWGK